MRVHVRPAHPEARIPDPTHGTDLPPQGCEVDWSAHWARLQMREDVIVTEIQHLDEISAASPGADEA